MNRYCIDLHCGGINRMAREIREAENPDEALTGVLQDLERGGVDLNMVRVMKVKKIEIRTEEEE